jgi:hypothetical protein
MKAELPSNKEKCYFFLFYSASRFCPHIAITLSAYLVTKLVFQNNECILFIVIAALGGLWSYRIYTMYEHGGKKFKSWYMDKIPSQKKDRDEFLNKWNKYFLISSIIIGVEFCYLFYYPK